MTIAGASGGLPPHTGSRRMTWDAILRHVQADIERLLGAAVVDAVGQPGGFSDGLASLLALADNRRVFIKAASSQHAPAVAEFHRREIAVSRQLHTEWTPRLLDAHDDGTWVAGIYAAIPSEEQINVMLAAHAGFLLRIATSQTRKWTGTSWR
jgi:hypothetical protein